ncbi:MAG: hypothetical protein WB341_10350 [Terracidiphilus sp.]
MCTPVKASAFAGFHICGMNLHCDGLCKHLDRQDEAKQILFANQDPFNAFQGTPRDPNARAAF